MQSEKSHAGGDNSASLTDPNPNEKWVTDRDREQVGYRAAMHPIKAM